jgi:DNA-binding Lrp family transcriptional regulator
MSKKRKGIWIPIEILQNKELDFTNKVLLTEILSLSKLENGCTAALPHFGELIGTNPSAAGKRIKKLEKWGYIKCKNQYSGRRVIGRTIKVLNILGNSSIPSNEPSSHDDSVLVDLQDVFTETHFDVSGWDDDITSTGHIDDSNDNQVMFPIDVSNGKAINSNTNSEIIIQEKIQYTSTEKNTGGKLNKTKDSSFNKAAYMNGLREELVSSTNLGKDILEFHIYGLRNEIIKVIGEEQYTILEPKLNEYKTLLFD